MSISVQTELLGGFETRIDAPQAREKQSTNVVMIPRSRIHLSERLTLRTVIDEADLAALATAIRGDGLLQPLIVRPHPERRNNFEVVVGTRRYRATAPEYAGIDKLPCVMHEGDEAHAEMVAMRGTLTSASICYLDEARMVARIKRNRTTRGEPATNEALANLFIQALGRGSTGWVSTRLTISENLPPELIDRSGLLAVDLMTLGIERLLHAAQLQDEDERIHALLSAVQQVRTVTDQRPTDFQRAARPRVPREPVSYHRIAHEDGSVSLRFCPSRMTQADTKLAFEHLTPILAALGIRLVENAPDAGGSHP